MYDYDSKEPTKFSKKNHGGDQDDYSKSFNDQSGKLKVPDCKHDKIFIHEFSKSKFVDFSTKYSYLPNYE